MSGSTPEMLVVAQGLALVAALMAVLWGVHLVIRNAAIVDAGWAASLPVLGIWYACRLGSGSRAWLVAALVGLWGGRLSLYLLRTRVIGHPEEGRYQELRQTWKTHLALKFFVFFEAQALLAWMLSVPILLAARHAGDVGPMEYVAAALWCVAVSGESIADGQLNRFKRDARNRLRVCDVGLWRYSRHPNYFFEWLVWVAYALYAIASPWGWVGVFAPALMLYFLFRVTGIPATEAQALRTRGDVYRRYQQTTSAFVPWFPRRARS